MLRQSLIRQVPVRRLYLTFQNASRIYLKTVIPNQQQQCMQCLSNQTPGFCWFHRRKTTHINPNYNSNNASNFARILRVLSH